MEWVTRVRPPTPPRHPFTAQEDYMGPHVHPGRVSGRYRGMGGEHGGKHGVRVFVYVCDGSKLFIGSAR